MVEEEPAAEFRFSSKADYSKEIEKVILKLNELRALNSKKSNKKVLKLEESYEVLIEEYLRFCAEGEGGQE